MKDGKVIEESREQIKYIFEHYEKDFSNAHLKRELFKLFHYLDEAVKNIEH